MISNEEFAADIRNAPVRGGNDVDLSRPLAKHLTDLGYSKPQQITTPEDLKALEDPEVVIVDFKQNAYQWGIGIDGSEGWQSTRDPNPITSDHLLRFAPLTVLHMGGAR